MEIRHQAERNRFVAPLEGGRALVDYEQRDDGSWDLTHTYVPEEHRHRGIASDLVRHILDRAAAEGRKIVPSCPFVADFIDRNDAYRNLVLSADSG